MYIFTQWTIYEDIIILIITLRTDIFVTNILEFNYLLVDVAKYKYRLNSNQRK